MLGWLARDSVSRDSGIILVWPGYWIILNEMKDGRIKRSKSRRSKRSEGVRRRSLLLSTCHMRW